MRKMIAAVLACLLLLGGCASNEPAAYGVFLGISGEEAERLASYSLVVIEPAAFTARQIKALQAEGKQVYGYLNIGAVEEYRPYYERFRALHLGVYEAWPDERWVDVASPAWQDFVVNELGRAYVELGLDGLFLDNTDVYALYPSEERFQGLCTILEGLGQYELPLVLNGGDIFVSRCMEEGLAPGLFDAVNQETVFTSIDFENGTVGVQPEAETAYFQSYLARVKEQGLAVYLLEYGAPRELAGKIDAYCTENGFLWYNAQGPELR